MGEVASGLPEICRFLVQSPGDSPWVGTYEGAGHPALSQYKAIAVVFAPGWLQDQFLLPSLPAVTSQALMLMKLKLFSLKHQPAPASSPTAYLRQVMSKLCSLCSHLVYLWEWRMSTSPVEIHRGFKHEFPRIKEGTPQPLWHSLQPLAVCPHLGKWGRPHHCCYAVFLRNFTHPTRQPRAPSKRKETISCE